MQADRARCPTASGASGLKTITCELDLLEQCVRNPCLKKKCLHYFSVAHLGTYALQGLKEEYDICGGVKPLWDPVSRHLVSAAGAVWGKLWNLQKVEPCCRKGIILGGL